MLKNNSLLRKCFNLLRHSYPDFMRAVACMLLLGLMQLPAPLLTMRVIDSVTSSNPRPTLVSMLCIGLLLVFLATLGVRAIQKNLVEKLRAKLVFRVQRRLLSSSLNLPMEYHLARSHGYIQARVNEDPYRIDSLVADSVLSITGDLMTLGIGIGFLFYVNWKLALLALVSVPISAALAWKMRGGLKSEFTALQEKTAGMSACLGEILANLISIKTLTLERRMVREYARIMVAIIRQRFRILRKRLLYEALITSCSGITPVVVLWYAALEIAAHRLTVGQFIAFSGYLAYLYRPAESITIAVLGLQNSIAAAERIFEIMDSPSEADSWRKEAIYGKAGGAIELRMSGVFVRYPTSAGWVLSDVNCQLRSGEITAIVGSSGGGKTTFVNLIPGLIRPDAGRVEISGLAYSSLTELRRQIAVVSQETFLFSTTIFENISMGSPAASEADVHGAARSACAEEFIADLPLGYHTRIAESGRSLSAGQRQRILIARAILRRPKIMILDEATSCLDVDTETRLLAQLKHAGIPMLIVVSHRESVVEFADRVLRIQSGIMEESPGMAMIDLMVPVSGD